MLKSCYPIMIGLLLLASPVTASDSYIDVGMLADVVVSGDEDLRELNLLRTGDAYTDFFHTRLFVDGGNARSAFFLQLMVSETAWDPVRIYGAYLQHQILENREFYVQAGKIPTPEGIWGPRTYADKNPLVAVPLAYFWQSSLPVNSVPDDLDALVAGKDGLTTYGALILYDNCWNDGITLLGVQSGISYLFSATRGAPGNPVSGTNENDEIAVHGRLGIAPIPEVEFSVSYGQGAYLTRAAQDDLDAGQSVNDYRQRLWVLSLALSRGYFEFHGEYFNNRYETPLRSDDLGSWSAYGELKWRFAAGWYAALRYDTLEFEEIQVAGGSTSWDTNIARWEGGFGYHLNRNFLLKGIVQVTDNGSGFGSDTTLPMLQAVLRF